MSEGEDRVGKKIARPVRPLGDVNVFRNDDGSKDIVACFFPDPDMIVGEKESRAVLALDASKSMKKAYGFGPFGEPNYVELVGRKLGQILCEVTRSGTASMMYWAMGIKGDETEIIGEFAEEECGDVQICGPASRGDWGRHTELLPTVKHIVEEVYPAVEWTMGVIITDGRLDDEEALTEYCLAVGHDLKSRADEILAEGGDKAEERAKDVLNSLKLDLIGVGDEVDEHQLQRIDDLFEGTDLDEEVDLWASGLAENVKDEGDIVSVLFAEMMGGIEVASSGKITDDQGNTVANFSDGMMGVIRFTLPQGCKAFTVKSQNIEVTQPISA